MTATRPILEEYVARTPKSASFFERAKRSLPGGETRSVTHYAPYPVALERGKGSLVVDLDGNEYVDVLNNYTALVHGHAYPSIVAAADAAARAGSLYPAPHLAQIQLAELIVARCPSVELVRFTNSGSEAALLALRVARAATGRRRVVLFDGAYHGTGPSFIDPDPDVVRIPYNDPDALSAVLDGSVAAVFAEPFLGSAGVVPAAPGFLATVQRFARQAGALFVLDEVQSLRNAVGGLHGELGLEPDLVLMGKIIGGGYPVGAVGGKADLLALTSAEQSGPVAHSGTFNGNPVTTAAGLACLRDLDAQAISRLNEAAARLAEGIVSAGRDQGLPVSVTRSGSILHVHLLEHAPTNAAEARGGPLEAAVPFLHLALLLEGVYAAPRGMLNLSSVVSDTQLDRVVEGYRRAFARVRSELPLTAGTRNQ